MGLLLLFLCMERVELVVVCSLLVVLFLLVFDVMDLVDRAGESESEKSSS